MLSSSVYGLKKRKAIYREGLGATLINDDFDESKPYLTPKTNKIRQLIYLYPYGNLEPKDTVFPDVDYEKLNKQLQMLLIKKEKK